MRRLFWVERRKYKNEYSSTSTPHKNLRPSWRPSSRREGGRVQSITTDSSFSFLVYFDITFTTRTITKLKTFKTCPPTPRIATHHFLFYFILFFSKLMIIILSLSLSLTVCLCVRENWEGQIWDSLWSDTESLVHVMLEHLKTTLTSLHMPLYSSATLSFTPSPSQITILSLQSPSFFLVTNECCWP